MIARLLPRGTTRALVARRSLLAAALALSVGACSPASPSPQRPAPPGLPSGASPGGQPPSSQVALTLLYTSDEHGWVAPATEKGKTRGGAAELLSRWVQQEGHCVPGPQRSCEESATLALSGGDNWTGPALSSFFQGEVGAESMKRLGYAASALGNHELDFGRDAFARNAKIEGFPYLAANVEPKAGEGGVAQPFALFRRRGVTVGVVGLATSTTPKVGLRENYKGLSFGDEEAALSRAIPEAYKAGADAVVIVAHVCADVLRPILARHPDWRVAFAGAGHCHRLESERVFTTPVVEPGSFLRQYARVSLVVDRARPERERVVSSEVAMVELQRPEGEPAPVAPDGELSQIVSGWQQKADKALGEVIGYTEEPLEPDSAPLVNFLTDRWKEATGADVAIMNRFGTRQAIPKGPITLETIYSVLPFNNRLVLVKVTGEQLQADINCCHGHVAGLRRSAEGNLVMDGGKPLDPKATYTVAITDYIYYGGSDFLFEKQDPSPRFGDDWREPLIRWLRAHPTSPGKGLEGMLDRKPRLRDPAKKK